MSTLKELLQKATPGYWKARRHGNQYRGEWRIDASGWTNFAQIYCGEARLSDPIAEANAQLIARCNPQTMALVLEALNMAANQLKPMLPENRHMLIAPQFTLKQVHDKLETALAALNNPAP